MPKKCHVLFEWPLMTKVLIHPCTDPIVAGSQFVAIFPSLVIDFMKYRRCAKKNCKFNFIVTCYLCEMSDTE